MGVSNSSRYIKEIKSVAKRDITELIGKASNRKRIDINKDNDNQGSQPKASSSHFTDQSPPKKQ